LWISGTVFLGLMGLRVGAEEVRVAPSSASIYAEAPAPLRNSPDFPQVLSPPTDASHPGDLRYGDSGVVTYGNEMVTAPPAAWINLDGDLDLLSESNLYPRSDLQRRLADDAVVTSRRSGATHYSGDVSGTTQHLGSLSYTTLSAGGRTVSGTTSHVGRTSYTTWSDGTSATTQHLGGTSYTNTSDGRSATTQHIGSFSYTTGSDGSSATTQRIGNFSYTTVSP
jgi:hypothetical protein